MRNAIIINAVLFVFVPFLRTATAQYHNPINNSLIKAIIEVESSGNPKAMSREGAWGLMQVRHGIWEKELKKAGIIRHKRDLLNPGTNIRAGRYILMKYYSQTGCLEKTLKKYSGSERSYYEKVMATCLRQMKADYRLSLFWRKPLDREAGSLEMERKRHAGASGGCADFVAKYRAGAGR